MTDASTRRCVAAILVRLSHYRDKVAPEADPLRTHAWTLLVEVILNQDKWGRDKAGTLKQRLSESGCGWSPTAVSHIREKTLHAAVSRTPAVARYHHRATGWIHRAARLVVDSYGGHTARLWREARSLKELIARLKEVPGISQKKANLYARSLGKALGLRDWHNVDIPADAHILRVLHRSGLSPSARLQDVIRGARRVWPSYPGELDRGAWYVGTTWCSARHPRCEGADPRHPEAACPLHAVCAFATRRRRHTRP